MPFLTEVEEGKLGMFGNPPFALAHYALFQIPQEGYHCASPVSCEAEFLTILTWLIEARRWTRVLEIGTAHGHSAWWFDQAVGMTDPGGQVVTVDIRPLDPPPPVELYPRTQFVTADSQEFLRSQQGAAKFDFVFVDGSHTTAACLADVYACLPMLKVGGAIAIHDTLFLSDVGRAIVQLQKEFPNGEESHWLHLRTGRGLSILWPHGSP